MQAAFDAADTVNYASTMAGPDAGGRVLYISTFEGGANGFPTDPVVPVNSTRRLIDTVGGSGVTRVNSVGATQRGGNQWRLGAVLAGRPQFAARSGPLAGDDNSSFKARSQISSPTGGDFITITDGTVIAP